MWHLRRPTSDQVGRFLDEQRQLPLSYQLGQTTGFCIDDERILLGQGEAVFLRACRAIEEWKMFPVGWIQIVPQRPPVRVNQVVGVLARAFRLWWMNACRIVSIVDDVEPVRRFGFTYATLPGHVEMGEETFVVEWDADGQVWYRIRAVSRPRYWLLRVTYPLARWMQRLFRRDSQRSMQDAVQRE